MAPILSKYLALVALLGSACVKADWASLSDGIKGGAHCSNGQNAIGPFFDNTSWDSLCDRLVADGCARPPTFSGKANVGGGAWSPKTDDFTCEEVAPAGHLTCTNQFRNAYSNCGPALSQGARDCSVSVFNGDGDVVGGIGFVAVCPPPPGGGIV